MSDRLVAVTRCMQPPPPISRPRFPPPPFLLRGAVTDAPNLRRLVCASVDFESITRTDVRPMYVLKQVMNYGTARSATPSQPEDSTTETDNGKQSDPPSPQGVPSRLEREGVDVHKSDGRNAISQEESRAAHTTPDGTSLPTTSTQLVLASQASSLLHQFPVDNALLTSNSSTTLLPTSIAQLISAVSIAARISLKASALFLEAILESAQCTTDTSMGITRRALILAVQSARRLQMANLLGSSDGQHRSQDNSDSSQRRSSIE